MQTLFLGNQLPIELRKKKKGEEGDQNVKSEVLPLLLSVLSFPSCKGRCVEMIYYYSHFFDVSFTVLSSQYMGQALYYWILPQPQFSSLNINTTV